MDELRGLKWGVLIGALQAPSRSGGRIGTKHQGPVPGSLRRGRQATAGRKIADFRVRDGAVLELKCVSLVS